MVLFKRKPVKLDPPPQFLDDNTEIWAIKETGEIFLDYEQYIKRYDFYQQRSFTCESTGHSNYTYFEAKESETEATKEINSIFPDGLRSPVLCHVQFRTTSRMDDLVNNVFDHFKEHFMVGDSVSVEGDNSRRYGKIIDIVVNNQMNTMYPGQTLDDIARSFTYTIQVDNTGEIITKSKPSEILRDRKVYSKLIIKQFLRNTVKREPWIGAPWMVKDSLAKRYDIPTKIPDNKTRDAVLAQKKAVQAILPNGNNPAVQQPYQHFAPNGYGPYLNGHDGPSQGLENGQTRLVSFSSAPPYATQGQVLPPFATIDGSRPPYIVNAHPISLHHQPPQPPQLPQLPQLPLAQPPIYIHTLPPYIANIINHNQPSGINPLLNTPFQTSFPHHQGHRQSDVPLPQQSPPIIKQFETVKYPCEDLEIRTPRLATTRPPLKFFSDNVPEGVKEPLEDQKTGILMYSVGLLLCTWETLNVHDSIYMLDSFTFDDFVDAMRFTSDTVECELFVEVHCSVLKQIVDDSGKILTNIPKLDDSDDTSEEEDEASKESTPEPEPPVRTTRSSLRKSGAALLLKNRTPTPEPPQVVHRAAEFDADFDWIEHCKLRNFREGGWQCIIVAILYRLSTHSNHTVVCEEILAELVPPDEEPTVETIMDNYERLDVNLRISALELLLRLTIVTEAFREQLVQAALEMTRLRKEKIEYQRKRKELADELFKLDLDRKIQLPANTPASPTMDTKDDVGPEVSMASVTGENKGTSEAEGNDFEPIVNRKTRHANKNKRKAAAEEARKEKAKKAKAEAEKTKKQKEWETLLGKIGKKKDELRDCEAKINELDDDLRETLVHRSKVLGKDRFLNKYYWFEHNGMPFGGLPNSSTAEYGYANGRIWVQGPDEYELAPNLDEPAVSEDLLRFGFTIPQRKEKEEGPTHLSNSEEWAYYDDPDDIDKLINWLDERGSRERALRKELQIFRDRIAEYMIKMKKHLSPEEDTEEEEEEEIKTRVSARNKKSDDKDVPQDRCLSWTNSIMRGEHGHTHYDEYEPPRKSRSKTAKAAKGKGRR